ncbi:MAG: hypothetical protein CVU11_10885, partial [Bacteroidetes bacterium HGW-Bacteroidetes-6]
TSVPAQPSAITGNASPCSGATGLTYSVTNVAGVTYTWGVPAGWSVTAGAGTNSITVTAGAASGNITVTPSNACGNGTAQTLAVAPGSAPSIVTDPSNSTIGVGGNTSFTVLASGTGLTYQWQVSTDGGSTFNNIVAAGTDPVYSNWTTATLSVNSVIGSNSGYEYQCIISGTCSPSVTSGAAILTVNGAPAITTHPANSSVCDGGSTGFSVVASGSGLNYQWQVSTDGGSTFNNIVAAGTNPVYSDWTTNTLSLNAIVLLNDGFIYQCVVDNGVPPVAVSNQATLTVNDVPAQPSAITGNATPCSGSTGLTYSVTNVAGVTYTWTVPAGWSVTAGAGTNSITVTAGASSGNITVTPGNACGNGTAQTLSVAPTTVPAQPSAITGNATPCSGTTGLTYSVTNVVGVTYTWSVPAGWSVTAGAGTNSITVTAGATSGNITVTPSNACGNGTAQALAVAPTSVPAQPSAITGNVTPCSGATGLSYSVTNVAGVTYTWSVPAGWSVTAGAGTNSITVTAGAASGNITVTPSNACGNGTAQALAVATTEIPLQPIVINGNTALCVGMSNIAYWINGVAGESYSWTVPSGWTILNGQGSDSINVTPAASGGNIVVVPVNSCGFGPAQSLTVSVNDIPSQPSIISGNASPCENEVGLIYSVTNVTGITYSWTVPTGWSIVSGQGTNAVTVSAGSATGNIVVTPSNGCGSGTGQTLAVITNSVPAQPSSITGNTSPCENSTGLVYSITNVSGVSYNWIVPTGWSITAGQGTNSITVDVGTTSGNIVVTPSNGCGNGTAQFLAVSTTSVPVQPSSISGSINPCESTTGLIYSVTNVAGVTYTWSVPLGWSITAGQGTSTVTVTSGSSGTISVTPSNGCGNGIGQTLAITTTTVPAQPSSITGAASTCENAAGLIYSVTNVTGVTYNWSVPVGWIIIAGQGTNSIAVNAGTSGGSISVVPTNSCGSGIAQTLAVVTTSAPAQPSVISGNTNPCQNSTGLTYSITNVAGVTYNWVVPSDWSITSGQGTNTITIDVGSASGNISVTPSNSCGNGVAQILAVSTSSVPAQPSAITGSVSSCSGTTGLTYSVTNVAGVTYIWTVPTGWSITSGAGTNTITVTAGSASGNITVTPSNGCGNGATQFLAVSTTSVPAQPSVITGNANPCENVAGLTYSVANVVGVTYSWDIPLDWTVVSGQGTNTITVDAGVASGAVIVTPSNGCGNGVQQVLLITTGTTPAQPSSITGSVSTCEYTTGLIYSVTNVTGISYTWSVPVGWTIIAGQGTNSVAVNAGTTGGTISVMPSNGCGNGIAQTLAVVTTSVPAQPSVILGNASPCENTTGLVYSVTDVVGVTYTWTVPTGWNISAGQGTNSITVDAGTTAGSITVIPSNGCGNGVSQTISVVTTAIPAQPSSISGVTNPCENTTGLVYSVINTPGVTYTWSVPLGWSITAGQGTSSVTVTAGSSGTITVTPSNGCGNGAPQSIMINSGTIPAQPSSITGAASTCENAAGLIYGVTNITGVTYNWSVPVGWTIIAGQGTNSIAVNAGTSGGNISVVPTNGCGSGVAQTLTVSTTTVPAQPSAISGDAFPCTSLSGQIYSVSNISGVTYTWAVPAGWNITSGQGTNSITIDVSSTAGNVVVTPSNGCGNGPSQTLYVSPGSVPSQPSAITGSLSPCEGSTQIYSVIAVSAMTYTWTVPSDWIIVAGQGSDSITVQVGALSGSVSVTPMNACGSGIARILNVTPASQVTPAISISTTTTIEVCDGTPVTFNPVIDYGGTSPVITWYVNGSVVASGNTFTLLNPTDGDMVYAELQSSEICTSSNPVFSDVVTIIVFPIPSSPYVTHSGDTLFSNYSTGNQWYDSNGILSGETNNFLVPPIEGDYYVVYTDGNGCSSDPSDMIHFTFDGIFEELMGMKVYPNPSNDLFTIELPWIPSPSIDVVVSNVIGEVVYSTQVSEKIFRIDLGRLPDGVYHLTMYNEDNILNETLIKEK